jgi:Spy/CpxP family protein refolding chaperone
MKRSTLILALTLVFLSGIVVGAVGYRLYTAEPAAATERRPSPEEFRQRYVGMMKTRLNLSEDQLGRLNAILDETREAFRQLEEKSRTEKQALRDRQVEKINAILDETQRIEYEQIRKEREERRKQMEKLHGPPHGPGR